LLFVLSTDVFLGVKLLKNSFAPDPARGAYSAPPNLLAKKEGWREKDGMGRGNGKRGVEKS